MKEESPVNERRKTGTLLLCCNMKEKLPGLSCPVYSGT
jgi:hypothetical protein